MPLSTRQENLRRALAPRSICFVGGAFLEPAVLAARRLGFDGAVSIVNPSRDEIAGLACLDSVDDLEEAPDIVFLAVNRQATNALLPRLEAMGAAGAVCYAAGYAEVGGDGPALERELGRKAGDLAVIGPNCYGFNNYVTGALLMATPTLGERTAKGCAFIGQSGNICINIANGRRGSPLTHVISCGNQTVLDFADYIEVLVDDPAVTSFALFMESLPDVAAFSRAAGRALEAGKPIIVLKSGVSRTGARMALSHTASLAGDDSLYQALFDRFNVIRVETPEDLVETAKVVTVTGVPHGRRLAVFTCSGGDAECVADLVEPLEIDIPPLDDGQRDEIAAFMQPFTTIANPLDYNTSNWGRRDILERIFPVALRGEVDAALLVVDTIADAELPPGATGTGAEAAMLAFRDAARRHGVPGVITSSLPDNISLAFRARLHGDGIAMAHGIRAGTLALARTCLWGERRRLGTAGPALPPAAPAGGAARILDERESKRRLAAAGIPVPRGEATTAATAAAAARRTGFPVALKALSADIAHKTEAGGVALGLGDEAQVERAARRIAAATGVDRLLVEAMVEGHVAEMIVGVTRDDAFGPVLVIGAGGTLAEVIRDSVNLLVPAAEEDVRGAIGRLKVARLLDGYRGAPRGDREALVAAVMTIARLAGAAGGSLVELDLNPLLVMPEGAGVVAADAWMRTIDNGEDHE